VTKTEIINKTIADLPNDGQGVQININQLMYALELQEEAINYTRCV
jgi:hypothetical protein